MKLKVSTVDPCLYANIMVRS